MCGLTTQGHGLTTPVRGVDSPHKGAWPNYTGGVAYLSQLLVGLLHVGGLPEGLVGVQVILALRGVAVCLLRIRVVVVVVPVGLLVLRVALPVGLVRVEVGVFELVPVGEPAGVRDRAGSGYV